MNEKRRTPRKEMSESRKAELIEATLRLIARDGVPAATVRSIAEEAKVTQGLIRYYFRSKEELIIAAYEKHMTDLIDVAAQAAQGEFASAGCRLARFVEASVRPPIIAPQVIALWAGFFQMLFHHDAMRESHRKTYNLLRRHIKALIADLFAEQGRPVEEQALRELSIACNAILDGLWIEGGALPEEFAGDELVRVALSGFGALLQTDLTACLAR